MIEANDARRLAIFLSFSGQGGVERVILNLLQGLSAYAIQIDLVAIEGKHGRIPEIVWPNVRLIKLQTRHTHLALPHLIRYLKAERPDVLMAAKDRAVNVAVLARRLAGVDTHLIGQLHSTLSSYLADKTPLRRWWRLLPMRWLFPSVDRLVAVSEGVADDIAHLTGFPKQRIFVLPNPVIMPEMRIQSLEAIDHPWFNRHGARATPDHESACGRRFPHPGPLPGGEGDSECSLRDFHGNLNVPVIIGVGRLTPEKDFATLIQAFAFVRSKKDCRLLILGEGPMRSKLERKVDELGLSESVSMPGFVSNPYAYMSKSSLFVLSSTGEGSPTVLTEALGLGLPVVSTDCKSGPRETLQAGRYGRLVKVGDHQALALAMLETLEKPLASSDLMRAAADFTLESSARRYMEFFGFLPHDESR